MVAHGVTSVAGIVGHRKRVVTGFASDKKNSINGLVNQTTRSCLDETSQFVTSCIGQLTEQVVAEPVVASRVVESDFKLRPRTIEEVGSINVLQDQQWNAAGCKTSIAAIIVPTHLDLISFKRW